MAASSTDGFISGSGSLGCFNGGLLKPGQEKFWGAEVMATASTESFWEDDPEEQVKKKINELKSKFHSGRQLQVKHLPRDVTEEVSWVCFFRPPRRRQRGRPSFTIVPLASPRLDLWWPFNKWLE